MNALSWRRGLSLAGAMVAALACDEPTSDRRLIDPAIIGFTPANQWAGGAVEAASPVFIPALPVALAGDDTLAVSRVDDSTIAVTLPSTVSGPVPINFYRGEALIALGTVQVHGLVQARLVPGSLGYEPLVPEGLTPIRFVAEGAIGAPTSLTALDPATDQVTTLSGIGPVQSSFGVLPSYQQNRFVVRDSTGELGVWELSPAPLRLAASLVQGGAARHVTQLADTLWFTTYSNLVSLTTPSGTTFSGTSISDPLRLVFSPAGDRFALVLAGGPGGRVPVFDAHTGDTAYTLPLQNVEGAAFSPTGDRLYLSARATPQAPADSIIAYLPGTGQRTAAGALPAGYHGSALAMDPAGTALYEVADSAGTAALVMFDPVTLERIGLITTPGFGSIYYWSAGIAVDQATGRIHVAYPGSPIPVATFLRRP